MVSRTLSTTAIQIGERFDPVQMRVFVQHVERMTSEVQRIQQLLSGGSAAQVLTKTTARDYDGTWAAPSGGGGFPNAYYIVTVANPDLPNSRVLVAGDNISFDISVPGVLRISASGGGVVEAVVEGTGIDVDATDPANPVVGLNAAVVADLLLAETAVQPEDLEQVAFDGLYDSLIEKPPYRIVQNVADASYVPAQLKHGHTIIGVKYAGPAVVRLPHDLPINRIVSVKDEAGTADVTVVSY